MTLVLISSTRPATTTTKPCDRDPGRDYSYATDVRLDAVRSGRGAGEDAKDGSTTATNQTSSGLPP